LTTSRGCFAHPAGRRVEINLDKHNVGYLPMKGDTLRTSTVETVTKPNLNEALFVARDLPSDHSGRRGRSAFPQRQPLAVRFAGLPRRNRRLLRRDGAAGARRSSASTPVALDLPAEYFDQPFNEPQYKLRMTHYPHQTGTPDNRFGIAPIRIPVFSLCLPPTVPGLSIRAQSGRWIDAPPIPDAYVVNGGQLLQRWTNDDFFATPHRAVNHSGDERYALAFSATAISTGRWPPCRPGSGRTGRRSTARPTTLTT